MAGFHGLFLAAILYFNKRFRSKSNQFLAMALFAISIIVCYDFFYYSFEEEELPLVIQYLPVYIRTAIPIGLYFFVRYLIEPDSELKGWERLWYLPIVIEVILELLYIPINLFLTEDTIETGEHLLLILEESMGLFTSIPLLWLAIRKINSYQNFLLDNYSNLSGKSLLWLRNLVTAILLIFTVWLFNHMLFIIGFESEGTYSLVSFSLVIFLFWMGYFVILQHPLFQVARFKVTKTPATTSRKLSPKTDSYHQNLIHLMESESLYNNPELNLQNLANTLNISPGYLSQIINEKEHKNFFEFVNQYRVEEAKRKLINPDYDHYSIMGIALESGFNSKSTFNALFKKFTGHTPSSFKKMHQVQD